MGGRGSKSGSKSSSGGGGGSNINENEPLLPTIKKIQPWDLKKMNKEQLRAYSNAEYKNYHKYRDRLESNDARFKKDGSFYKGTVLRMNRHLENYNKTYKEASNRGYTIDDSNW